MSASPRMDPLGLTLFFVNVLKNLHLFCITPCSASWFGGHVSPTSKHCGSCCVLGCDSTILYRS
ncbi:hypothetical protein DsansV1_C05g0052741 [Dioscorea sansibarensis]